MVQEKKLFSEIIGDLADTEKKTKLFSQFISGSVSVKDAQKRAATYGQVFEKYEDLKRSMRTFSSYADNDVQANQYFDATVSGLANSIAGYITIERYMENPKGLIYYLDLIGATDGRVVLPNIGADNVSGISNKIRSASAAVSAVSTNDTTVLGKILLPGTVSLTFSMAGKADIVCNDNKSGILIAPPNVLSVGTVNYTTGVVEFDQLFAATGWNFVVTAVENQSGTQNVNRFKTNLNEYLLDTQPELLVGETDLISIAAMQKSLQVNPEEVVISKLTELYTKMINADIVAAVVNTHQGTAVTIDVATPAYADFRSRLDHFVADLADVDKALAIKSVKGVNATSYLCGLNVASFFKKTKALGLFTNAESSYINDLIGFFDGKPVIQHSDITENDAYAIHKTSDGNLAPVARGIYLPLTNTPAIGNYNNPSQIAIGVFYQEATEGIVPELSQRFTLVQ